MDIIESVYTEILVYFKKKAKQSGLLQSGHAIAITAKLGLLPAWLTGYWNLPDHNSGTMQTLAKWLHFDLPKVMSHKPTKIEPILDKELNQANYTSNKHEKKRSDAPLNALQESIQSAFVAYYQHDISNLFLKHALYKLVRLFCNQNDHWRC